MLSTLTAISPIDGRYREKVEQVAEYFSEFALIKYRLLIEVEYFIALCEIPLPELAGFKREDYKKLRQIYRKFSEKDALRVKEIEKKINHDVKAVEYFLKEKFDELGLSRYKEFVHFGLTSQDINNTAIPYALSKFIYVVYYPAIEEVLGKLYDLASEWSDITMLAHTHGQPASPTKLGKEIEVFIERLQKQLGLMRLIPFSAKFGGATGNFNAHQVAYPDIDWVEFADSFVNHVLSLERSQTTTQIDHYDHLAALLDNIRRINVILIDLAQDMWLYISKNYLKQRINPGEVGSSAMPHKVNPIDFENAEGNLKLANALLDFLSNKLPVSRLQRDLTDSTVLRNLGVPLAHTLLSFKSLLKGLSKVEANTDEINRDLERNWAVVAEAIQTILRKAGYPNPYEKLKELTRTGEAVTKEKIHEFIDSLDVSDELKQQLKQITPFNYTGIYQDSENFED